MTFKNLRSRQGLETTHVAKTLGVKVGTYRKYECYSTLPSKDILLKMKDVYKCNFSEVVQAYEIARRVSDERKSKKRNLQSL